MQNTNDKTECTLTPEQIAQIAAKAAGTEAEFDSLLNKKVTAYTPEEIVTICVAAATTEEGSNRLAKLVQKGISLKVTDKDGRKPSELLKEKLDATEFPANKVGTRDKERCYGTLSYLEQLEAEAAEPKKVTGGAVKKVIGTVIGAAFVIWLIVMMMT